MRIIEITALENGAHRNQSVDGEMALPNGWAVIPEEMELENFPFGEMTVEEVEGLLTVTGWTPGELPEPQPEEEPVVPVTDEEMAQAILNGINEI